MKPRKNAPTKPLGWHNHEQSYRVWAKDQSYLEDQLPWKCVAMFRYLRECLDYIAYCQDLGSDVVFESPAATKLIRATDRRVVCKPDAA